MRKTLACLLTLVLFGLSTSYTGVSAAVVNVKDVKTELKKSDSKLISVEEKYKTISGNTVITTVSKYESNITITDVLTIEAPSKNETLIGIASTSGTTTATKEKTIEGESSIIFYATLTATFEWDGSNSDCISYSTSKYVNPNFTLSTWDTSCGWYTFLGIKTGSSYADAKYYLYMTNAPMSYHDGIINIKCTKNGGIS